MATYNGKIIPVMFLVAGTCVGGGMLALPVATSFSGFIPSLIMLAICGLFMATTGLLYVEATLWMGPGAHIITMSRHLLGTTGKVIAAILFLFVSYFSLIAYIDGGGDLTVMALQGITGMPVAKWVAALIFSLVFGLVIYLGNKAVGKINTMLVVAMILAYLALLGGGMSHVQGHFLVRQDWGQGFYALPLLLTIFSFQTVVPSLVLYMNGDHRALKRAIIGGIAIALVIYSLWQLLILGIVPLDGLATALKEGQPATEAFRIFAQHRWISATGEFFAFFAIVTSFLGIGLGLFDFLADGLHMQRKGLNKFWLTLLTVTPCFVVAISYPRAFIDALDATGGFGDSILNGIIPALMVWSGRFIKGYKGQVMVRGGKWMLALIIVFGLFVLAVETLERIQFFTPIDDLR